MPANASKISQKVSPRSCWSNSKRSISRNTSSHLASHVGPASLCDKVAVVKERNAQLPYPHDARGKFPRPTHIAALTQSSRPPATNTTWTPMTGSEATMLSRSMCSSRLFSGTDGPSLTPRASASLMTICSKPTCKNKTLWPRRWQTCHNRRTELVLTRVDCHEWVGMDVGYGP